MTRAAHVRIDHTDPEARADVRPQIETDLTLWPNTAEDEHKARLTVVWLAADADDARDLLDKLGLL